MAKLLNETKEGDTIILQPLRKQLLVASDSEELRTVAVERLDAGMKRLIIDLSSVTYLSSVALGTLVALHVSYGKQGGKVHLCGCGSQLQLLLDMTKAGTVLSVYENVSQALAAF